jgi:protein gp37
MTKSRIEWTDEVWNPVTGCTKVSQGCKHCYAETIAGRFWETQYKPNEDGGPRKFTDIRVHAERLMEPLKWKKPRRVFVNSMSDLFHETIIEEFIDQVFEVMAKAEQHTFIVLTKRALVTVRQRSA